MVILAGGASPSNVLLGRRRESHVPGEMDRFRLCDNSAMCLHYDTLDCKKSIERVPFFLGKPLGHSDAQNPA